jgi:hypothetical protein
MGNTQILIPLLCGGILAAQTGPRVVHARTDQDSAGPLIGVSSGSLWEPVWITKVSIRDQFLLSPYDGNLMPSTGQLMPGQSFAANPDWLRDTTIYVMNRADKPLAWLELALQFPQPGNGRTEPTLIYEIRLGRMPDLDAFDGKGDRIPAEFAGTKPLDLQPGRTLVIHLADYIDQIRTYVRNAIALAEITRCNIYLAVSEFQDGLRYTGGAYSIPDPNQPGHWRYSPTRQYFPGDAHQYLPNLVRH